MAREWTKEEIESAQQELKRSEDPLMAHLKLAIYLQCAVSALREALEKIKTALDPDVEDSYRADDPEGAMETVFYIASNVLTAIPK